MSKSCHTSPEELYRLCLEGGAPSVVDVRESHEFTEGHAACAVSLPLSTLRGHGAATLRGLALQTPVYVICRSGQRSAVAAELLRAAGYDNVVNVTGGMLAWEASGLPVVRPSGKEAR